MPERTTEQIAVVALAVMRGAELLLVRKLGSALLILPGGKPLPGEPEEATLRRELHEELGCGLAQLRRFGDFADVAGHDPDRRLRLTLYTGRLVGKPQPSAEIAECCWMPLSARTGMAPIHQHINPALASAFCR